MNGSGKSGIVSSVEIFRNLANSFSLGMIGPVMSLVFLSHGAVIETLSLFVGLFSFSVILAELPSGIFADLFGRKNTFLLSHVWMLCSYFMMVFSRGPLFLAAACVFFGFGKAFASGSLDALAIEEYMKKNGKEGLSEINSQMLLLGAVGLAAGALCGGILGSVGERYTFLIASIIILESWILVFSGVFVKEEKRNRNGTKQNVTVKDQIIMMYDTVRRSETIRMILAAAAWTGSVQMILEVYWQQNFMSCIPGSMDWTIGAVSCLGYMGAIFGNKYGARLLMKADRDKKNIYRIFRLLFPVVVAALGSCKVWPCFILLYAFTYVVIGTGELIEKTILHERIDDWCRASVVSAYSFVIRIGGIFSSAAASVIVTRWGLGCLWIMVPAAAFVGILAASGSADGMKNKRL